MRFVVSWSQTVQHAATVEVTLDELAAWAIRSGALRTLAEGTSRPPVAGHLVTALERNPHLRARLLQLFAEHTNSGAVTADAHPTHPVVTTDSPPQPTSQCGTVSHTGKERGD